MNIENISFEKYLLEKGIAKGLINGGVIETYEATNTIMDAYKNVYNSQIEPRLAKNYQELVRKFNYSKRNIEYAKIRYEKFMTGKKFSISKKD